MTIRCPRRRRGIQAKALAADHGDVSSPRSSSHAFRYEDELCTLPAGVTLRDWRRCEDGPPARPSRWRRLRARLHADRRRAAD
jgi:hypothetical protein